MRRFGAVWRLGNDDLRGRPTPSSTNRADGCRRANGWRNVPGLGQTVLVPNAESGRSRNPRQSQQPQSGRRQRSYRHRRCDRALSAALFARSESYRKVLPQTQDPASQSRQTLHGRAMETNRRTSRHRLRERMHQLLRLLRICKHLNRKCSSFVVQRVCDFSSPFFGHALNFR